MKKILYVLLIISSLCACADILPDDISETNQLVSVNINWSIDQDIEEFYSDYNSITQSIKYINNVII